MTDHPHDVPPVNTSGDGTPADAVAPADAVVPAEQDWPAGSAPAESAAPAVGSASMRSDLTDGEWHRLHPLTPLLQGGIVLIIIFSFLISRAQEQIVRIFMPRGYDEIADEVNSDPIEWILANNFVLWAILIIAGVLLVIVALFYVSWRFHKFRITNADVEVMKGVLFRSHRRAPLDRVQGVNLTRPLFARLVGLAKVEVVGAGNDANVMLQYLTTANAEDIRADILRLASGARTAAQRRQAAVQGRSHLLDKVGDGITGIISGVEHDDVVPESVVKIPTGRLVASNLISLPALTMLALIVAIIVLSILGQGWVLFTLVPFLLAFGGVQIKQLFTSLRYSIAPTRDGVMVQFGLTTTVTEIVPPGRIHALEVSQSLLWRPFGWYRVQLIRISGKNVSAGQIDQFRVALPVGKRADVEKVLSLLMPDVAASDWNYAFEHGVLGPQANDPFTVTPRRAWFIRPLSFKRNGYLFHPVAFMMRRGQLVRSLALFPLSRAQSVAMEQGPISRRVRVGKLKLHTVMGAFTGTLAGVDRDNLITIFSAIEAAILDAEAKDRSHRWAQEQ